MYTVDPGYSTSRTTSRIVGTELFRSPTTYGISRTLEAWYVRTGVTSISLARARDIARHTAGTAQHGTARHGSAQAQF